MDRQEKNKRRRTVVILEGGRPGNQRIMLGGVDGSPTAVTAAFLPHPLVVS